MPTLKKLSLAPLIILFSITLVYSFIPALREYLDIFFKPYFGVREFGLIALSIILLSLSFVLFVTFSQKFIYALIISLASSLVPFIFLDFNLAIVLSICLFLSFLLCYFNLQTSLKTYIDFNPPAILSGPLKLLNIFILFSLTFTYFLNTNSIIRTQGFQIPKPFIEWAVDITLQMQGMSVKGEKYYFASAKRTADDSQPVALAQALTPEQLELLRQNPGVLEQFGINAADLDEFITPTQPTPNQDAVRVIPEIPGVNLKDVLTAQTANILETVIKPYITFIPFLLAFIFFSTISLLTWFLSIFLSPVLAATFYILEKAGFIKYQKEMREVKKIII